MFYGWFMVGDFCLSSSGRSSEGAVLVFFFVFLGAAYTFVFGGYKYVLFCCLYSGLDGSVGQAFKIP